MYAFTEEMGNSEAISHQFTSMQQDRSTVSRNGSFGVSIRQAEHKPPEISMKEHTNMHTVPWHIQTTYLYTNLKRIQIGNVIWASQLKRLRKKKRDVKVILTIQYSNIEIIYEQNTFLPFLLHWTLWYSVGGNAISESA